MYKTNLIFYTTKYILEACLFFGGEAPTATERQPKTLLRGLLWWSFKTSFVSCPEISEFFLYINHVNNQMAV